LASLTIGNLEDPLKAELRSRAAHHGRSIEEEAHVILRSALSQRRRSKRHLAESIHDRFAAFGGVDLPEIVRGPGGDQPDFQPADAARHSHRAKLKTRVETK
jgi:antitoxin FitA